MYVFRVLRGVVCLIFCVLLVLLVPSSAWSVGVKPGPSVRLALSLDHCGSSGDEPPVEEPHVCVTATETATATATATVTETVVEQGEATCGSGDLPPCAVQLDEGDDPWLLVACGLGVCMLGAILVTAWGQAGD